MYSPSFTSIDSYKPPSLHDSWKAWKKSRFLNESDPASVWNTIFWIELPLVLESFNLATHGKFREIIQLDKSAGAKPWISDYQENAVAAGRDQLHALSPLTDHKGIQSMIAALNRGTCLGHQPVIYGLFFNAYSIPIRQGLIYYAEQYRSLCPKRFAPLDQWNQKLIHAVNETLSQSSPESSEEPQGFIRVV